MSATTLPLAPAEYPVYRFSTEQYEAMLRVGILDEGVELIDGLLLWKGSPPNGEMVPYHITVEQYHSLDDAGILTEMHRVELVEGEVIPKMTRKPPHDATLDRLEDWMRAAVPPGWRVRAQKAITLATGEPEPDVAVVRGPASRYDDHHPGPAEIALVAEVADSSLAIDRGLKRRAYARAGLPVYWVVNLVDERIEVYTDPDPAARTYRSHTDYRTGQSVPLTIGGVVRGPIPVADVLPQPPATERPEEDQP